MLEIKSKSSMIGYLNAESPFTIDGWFKTGDLVEIKDKSKSLDIVLNGQESSERDVPDYIECDQKKLTAKLTRIPKLDEVPYPVQMEPNLVVEFYSRN